MARMADPSRLGAARSRAARSLVDAMRAHPMLVAGEGRACTELMEAMGGRVAIKTGAEGVFTAILPERGLGVALKVEDGATRGSECAIAAILIRLGALDPDHPAARRRLTPDYPSRRGLPAARLVPDPAFWANGAPL
jgi:L-asparaginase II